MGSEPLETGAHLGGSLGAGIWRHQEAGARRGEAPSALARSRQGDLAVGDSAGVSWRVAGDRRDSLANQGGDRMRALLPSVRDLAFDEKGQLWIATAEGLYRWHRSGRPVRRPLPGAKGNPGIHDLAVSGNVLLVASEVGAYWSSSGAIFQPLEFDGVGAGVSRVALRGVAGGRAGESGPVTPGGSAEAWLLGGNRLVSIGGRVTPVGLRVLDRKRHALPRPRNESKVVSLTFDSFGERLALIYPDLIAIRGLESGLDPATAAHRKSAVWELHRPVLAPGTRVRSLVWARDGVALSTDHGVFVAPAPEGPYQRAADPVGTGDCTEVRLAPDRTSLDSMMTLCRAGLFAFEGRSESSLARDESQGAVDREIGQPMHLEPGMERMPSLTRARISPLPPDPPVEEIRRRAFARAGLDARRSAALWSGLRRRAFWPELELRFGAEFDDEEALDQDQSFLSGDTRHLLDRSRDRGRSFDAAIALDWDFGGIAYPLESVDLSRELRQIVSLRDDVADEINQLYFERQRLRASIALAADLEPGELTRMRWRAKEIDAGLDAWTGGWIARWRSEHRSHPRSTEADGP